jgi:hypothetical protein
MLATTNYPSSRRTGNLSQEASARNKVYRLTFKHVPGTTHSVCAFNAEDPTLTWHRRYMHVGYSGIKKPHENQLVEEPQIDMDSPRPDCVACTEAKLSENPYDPAMGRQSEPGEMTRIDPWGKYDVASIQGKQTYLLMVDDTARYKRSSS